MADSRIHQDLCFDKFYSKKDLWVGYYEIKRFGSLLYLLFDDEGEKYLAMRNSGGLFKIVWDYYWHDLVKFPQDVQWVGVN